MKEKNEKKSLRCKAIRASNDQMIRRLWRTLHRKSNEMRQPIASRFQRVNLPYIRKTFSRRSLIQRHKSHQRKSPLRMSLSMMTTMLTKRAQKSRSFPSLSKVKKWKRVSHKGNRKKRLSFLQQKLSSQIWNLKINLNRPYQIRKPRRVINRCPNLSWITPLKWEQKSQNCRQRIRVQQPLANRNLIIGVRMFKFKISKKIQRRLKWSSEWKMRLHAWIYQNRNHIKAFEKPKILKQKKKW